MADSQAAPRAARRTGPRRARLPPWLLDLALRASVKPWLARCPDAPAMRASLEASARRYFRPPSGTRIVEETLADGDRRVPVLWVSCNGAGRKRVLLYLHGGAYIAGSPRTHRHLAAHLACDAQARGVVPDYALAPERPFPAALEDALACYRALLARGYEADRIALAGDSAGGGLAAALLLRLQAEGLPRPAALVAFSPWADMTMRAESLARNARRDAMLPPGRMAEVVEKVLGGASPADPYASPALGRFERPPPALIFASRSEIMLDDGVALSEALRTGGGDVQLELRARMPHAWPIFVGWLKAADEAVALAARFLARHMDR